MPFCIIITINYKMLCKNKPSLSGLRKLDRLQSVTNLNLKQFFQEV
jgi:hypothetical protein